MTETGKFKCLRCGHNYEDKYTPKVTQERSCPSVGVIVYDALRRRRFRVKRRE